MNILIAAVGGQGALLASRILGELALELNFDVKVSEVHGMSQRGGSVVTYVKFGKKVYSPIIEKGAADVVLAFEKLEGARYAEYLKAGGTLIVNDQKIAPMPVIVGESTYPDLVFDDPGSLNIKVVPVNAARIAREAGNIKAVNVVLIGLLAQLSGFEKEKWTAALKRAVPPKFLELNLKAFEMGYSYSTK